jgi:signal transduction histidine kinase/ActR/RegA family two-component response regulator
MKLRTHLFLLTVVTVVPVVLFAAGLIVYHTQLERTSVERGMRDTARALALALDRDIGDIKNGVETLAASRHLDAPADLRRFYDEAATVSKSFGGWAVLSEPSGQQALNTSRPFGAALPMPSARSLAMMRSVAASRQTFVSNVFIGTVSRRPAVIIAVPVIRGGEVRYVLDFPLEPTRFTSLLQEAALSPGWIAVITDRDGGVVARVPDPDAFVGQKVPPVWVKGTFAADEGFLRGPLLSESDVYAAYKLLRHSGWIVGVAAPASLVGASARRSLLALSAGGVVLLAVASALAFVLGRRIAEPIVALADSLKTQTAPAPLPRTTVREVDELRRALDEATERRRLLETEQVARAEAEQRAEREQSANRAKDDFLAVLSHELRTPLNSMLGWIKLLRTGTLDAAKATHALDVIERNVGQQARLISDLLDVSRIVIGRLELTMREVDLPAVVASAADAVRPAAEAKEITLTSRLARDAGPVRGDLERLRQIVENLLGNAIKFTPPGGHVTLQLVRDGEARLTVTDTGKGIDPEFLPHIFERFRQADSTSTRAHAGLGLGLAIVRHLVEVHGGRVSADSAGEGKGATFTVTLPLVARTIGEPTGRDDEADTAVAARSYVLDGVKILVVDDDADTRDLLATVLAQHGAILTTVPNAREGLAAARRLLPDVLVCDIAMPGDDGYMFVGQVRSWATAAGARVPALALTAYARPEDRERALAAGFDLHLAKPVEPAELVAAMARLAGRDDGVDPDVSGQRPTVSRPPP